MKKNKPEKVICAMSGGVDSSMAAVLLKRQGFEVTGVFMRLVETPRFLEGERTAKKIAKSLNIPLLVINLKTEFKKKIINEFIKEYKSGRTPNPCVICNREMKFKFLLKERIAKKADFIATGHYARLKKGKLLKGKDKEKDQSYFLWQLNQRQLKHTLFPLGNYTKKQVKNLARKYRLPIFKAPESQEICFIRASTGNFLKKHLKTKKGRIIDTRGKTMGKHLGLPFYTIGQRKGIKLPGGPYYVLKKNLKENILVVTKNEKDLLSKELTAKMVNWIRAPSGYSVLDRAQEICALVSGNQPKFPLKIEAKIRYRHKAAPATISKIADNKYKIIFKKSQRAVTPGQSVVFYRGEELLGGGIID